jgi:hypothetical protein
MQEPALLDMLDMQHNISIASTARRRHNVLVKRKRGENDDNQYVDDRTHGSHALRDFPSLELAQIHAFQSSLDEGRAKPPDHGIASAECNAT